MADIDPKKLKNFLREKRDILIVIKELINTANHYKEQSIECANDDCS
jgi:hypothetical protein